MQGGDRGRYATHDLDTLPYCVISFLPEPVTARSVLVSNLSSSGTCFCRCGFICELGSMRLALGKASLKSYYAFSALFYPLRKTLLRRADKSSMLFRKKIGERGSEPELGYKKAVSPLL